MGKRYYCDYCDKTFPDNPTNRRNHLNGVQHRTVRKLYYDAFQGKFCWEQKLSCSVIIYASFIK